MGDDEQEPAPSVFNDYCDYGATDLHVEINQHIARKSVGVPGGVMLPSVVDSSCRCVLRPRFSTSSKWYPRATSPFHDPTAVFGELQAVLVQSAIKVPHARG